jgi:hypothetical protein
VNHLLPLPTRTPVRSLGLDNLFAGVHSSQAALYRATSQPVLCEPTGALATRIQTRDDLAVVVNYFAVLVDLQTRPRVVR